MMMNPNPLNLRSTLRAPRRGGLAGAPIARAFTIIELLVVISIIALVVGATIPALQAMQEGSRVSAGVNTIGVAVEAARQLATLPVPDADPPTGASYSGVAVLVMPSGEIRLVENNQKAQDSGNNWLETTDYDPPDLIYGNGFDDIDGRDYITIPSRVQLYGLGRNSTGAVRVLDPPFAIRFNEHGNLINSDASGTGSVDRQVFYDGDLDGDYENTTRGSYTLDDYDADANWNVTEAKHEFPHFERIETVVGVRVVEIGNEDNYQDVFFSRYSGAPLRPND